MVDDPQTRTTSCNVQKSGFTFYDDDSLKWKSFRRFLFEFPSPFARQPSYNYYCSQWSEARGEGRLTSVIDWAPSFENGTVLLLGTRIVSCKVTHLVLFFLAMQLLEKSPSPAPSTSLLSLAGTLVQALLEPNDRARGLALSRPATELGLQKLYPPEDIIYAVATERLRKLPDQNPSTFVRLLSLSTL